LQTFIDLTSPDFLEFFLVTTAVAVGGMILGTAIAARAVGEPWPVAIGLGSLLQTKGLMEVVILTIFRADGLISKRVFSALILMSLVCTTLTDAADELDARAQRAARSGWRRLPQPFNRREDAGLKVTYPDEQAHYAPARWVERQVAETGKPAALRASSMLMQPSSGTSSPASPRRKLSTHGRVLTARTEDAPATIDRMWTRRQGPSRSAVLCSGDRWFETRLLRQ
jgi:hypothetical protein